MSQSSDKEFYDWTDKHATIITQLYPLLMILGGAVALGYWGVHSLGQMANLW